MTLSVGEVVSIGISLGTIVFTAGIYVAAIKNNVKRIDKLEQSSLEKNVTRLEIQLATLTDMVKTMQDQLNAIIVALPKLSKKVGKR